MFWVARGFVGSHLVDLLVNKGEKVVVVDNFFLGKMENLKEAMDGGEVVIYHEDARYLTTLEHVFEREKPDVVFNLAVQPLPYSFINPEGAYMTSVEIAHNLVHLLGKKAYKKLVHFSSSEAYGSAVKTPMDETHPLNPTTPYGAGKASADLMLLSYHKLFNLDISIVRPFNLIGERQNIGKYLAVVPATVGRLLRGEKPVIEGSGCNSRDFTYVGDVVEAAFALSECEAAVGRAVNVGQGRETRIKDLIRKICDIMGCPASFEYRPPRPADVERMVADVSLAKKLINYSPKVDLDEGIRRAIEYYKTL